MKKEKSEFTKSIERLETAQTLLSAAPDMCPALARAKEFFREQLGLSSFIVRAAALADSEGGKMEFSEDVVLLSRGAFDMAVRLSYVLAVALSSGSAQAVDKAIEKYAPGKERMKSKVREYMNAGH